MSLRTKLKFKKVINITYIILYYSYYLSLLIILLVNYLYYLYTYIIYYNNNIYYFKIFINELSEYRDELFGYVKWEKSQNFFQLKSNWLKNFRFWSEKNCSIIRIKWYTTGASANDSCTSKYENVQRYEYMCNFSSIELNFCFTLYKYSVLMN